MVDDRSRGSAERALRAARLARRGWRTAAPIASSLVRRAGSGLDAVRTRHRTDDTDRKDDTGRSDGVDGSHVDSDYTDSSQVGTDETGRGHRLSRRMGGASIRPRGLVVSGVVWTGDRAEPFDGVVVLDARGVVVNCAPAGTLALPADLPALGGPGSWVGPGITDAHVHLAFGGLDGALAAGLVGLRDLGAPAGRARTWRSGHGALGAHRPFVAVAGPILTAPGGYPSQSWGRDGFSLATDSPAQARELVHRLATEGVDLIKIALEPAGGLPVPGPAIVRTVVDTAHAAGLPVIAHALTAEMVGRALDAGVDELAHTPVERLSDDLVQRIADAGVAVVSTLQTFFAEGVGRSAAANAADLVAAGVELRYGTDLGNTGTRPGVDPRELDRLAETGLGRMGALRAATLCSGRAGGMRGRGGLIRVGQPSAVVVLPDDPRLEPGAWRTPTAVVSGGHIDRLSRA